MRCNCGVNPTFLADQHLIVEARELGMVAGSLKANNYKVIAGIPATFNLGKGHINFFKDKLLYLHNRWKFVVDECANRGFHIQKPFYDLNTFPAEFVNTWVPAQRDTDIIRARIVFKLNLRIGWYRYRGEYISPSQHGMFCEQLKNSPLYFV